MVWKFNQNGNIPLTVDFWKGITIEDFLLWYKDNKETIDLKLLEVGAILLRGLPIDEILIFEKVLEGIAEGNSDYIDGNSPRIQFTDRVYSSTEYDQSFFITLHNELSYSSRWPEKILFCCLYPSETGGETPIADCRKVLERIDESFITKVEEKGIKYIRNLYSHEGLGPTWQKTFMTNDKLEVEKFCLENAMQFEWLKGERLKIVSIRKGIIRHPVTKEKVWFNQIDQFHPSHFENDVYKTLMSMHNDIEEDLPTFVTLGDGEKISEEMLHSIRKSVMSEMKMEIWQQGDILILDNVLVSHGRMPFKGKRKIVVSLM